jgi:hypothetical protein
MAPSSLLRNPSHCKRNGNPLRQRVPAAPDEPHTLFAPYVSGALQASTNCTFFDLAKLEEEEARLRDQQRLTTSAEMSGDGMSVIATPDEIKLR